MSEISEKIRYILQFDYDKSNIAAHACEEICHVYGEGAQSETKAKR